jgi:ribosomal protein L22
MADQRRKTEPKGAGDKPPVKKAEPKEKAAAEKQPTPKRAARKPAATKATAAKSGGKAPAKKATPKPKAAPKAKPAAEKAKLPPPIVRASAKYVRVAPRKARLVADQVRGLQIDKARALLQFSPRSAAQDIAKVLDSAASNAENNHELIADDMKVMEITVDEGPTLRRWRPRALGRATRINKRTSHISIALTPEEES